MWSLISEIFSICPHSLQSFKLSFDSSLGWLVEHLLIDGSAYGSSVSVEESSIVDWIVSKSSVGVPSVDDSILWW